MKIADKASFAGVIVFLSSLMPLDGYDALAGEPTRTPAVRAADGLFDQGSPRTLGLDSIIRLGPYSKLGRQQNHRRNQGQSESSA